MRYFFNKTMEMQAFEDARDLGGTFAGKEALQELIAESANVELTPGNNGQELLVGFIKEIESPVSALCGGNSLGNSVQFLYTIGGVWKGGDEFKIPIIGRLEQADQGKEAVNILFHGGILFNSGSVSLVDFPIVLELGDIVNRGLNTQDQTKLIIHLDRECTHLVLYSGSQYAGIEIVPHFALIIPVELLSQEGGDILGFNRVNCRADELLFSVLLFHLLSEVTESPCYYGCCLL